MSARGSLRERFDAKYRIADDGCWVWTASSYRNGYGHIRRGPAVQGMALAHRVSYELHVGPIPDGMQIDHLCRNRACVNPAHLEPVTCRENLMRSDARSALNARKTRCHRGHDFTTENTYINARGHRICRACGAASARERRRAA